MWTIETTRICKTSKENIWETWTNVSNWSEWDSDVEYSSIAGRFEVGTEGFIKSKGGPKSIFSIVECTNTVSFTNRTKLPLCTIDFIHVMSEMTESIAITHRVEMSGLLTFLFSRIIGKGLKKSLPNAVESLIKLVEDEK